MKNRNVRNEFELSQSKKAREAVKQDGDRLHYHLMAPVGWLNDPNGLCQFHGTTHIFYQYTPGSALGNDHRGWGHYTTADYIHYREEDDPLVPDTIADAKGSYSGSAWIKDDTIHFFFTGNNKLPGNYDYINEGRTHWTLHFESQDGFRFTDKEVLMKNEDYPSDLSCHVRDPKIIEKNGIYYMVLGARTRQGVGRVELFASKDLKKWTHASTISTQQPFGYMWECPDLFEVDGHTLLMCCPQGMKREGILYENASANGYFQVQDQFDTDQIVDHFTEFDNGFDFYAPQSFEDEKHRRILIGWIGMPDVDYVNPTVKKGWQHCLSMPRRLWMENGTLHQYPIEEMLQLRQKECSFTLEPGQTLNVGPCTSEIELHPGQDCWQLNLRQDCQLCYENQILSLKMGPSGYGRDQRDVFVEHIDSLQIFSDTSVLEIFVNHGEKAMTTRVYDQQSDCLLRSNVAMEGKAWTLSSFVIEEKLDKKDPTISEE